MTELSREEVLKIAKECGVPTPVPGDLIATVHLRYFLERFSAAIYEAGAKSERAVSDRLLYALKEAYFDGWRDKITYNDFEESDVNTEFAKSDTAKLIAEVEALRKEKPE